MKLDVIHRADPGGPEASIDCANGSAAAAWAVPAGQLLLDHPELNTGGYVYFTLDSTPIDVIKEADGGDAVDFSGTDATEGLTIATIMLNQVEPGVVYRAHILLAYEDGRVWHNDTQFVCSLPPVEITETPVSIEVETLPVTGLGDSTGLLLLAAFLVAGGISVLRRWWE